MTTIWMQMMFSSQNRGQAKLVVEPSQHSHQYPMMYPLEDPEDMLTDDEDELLQGRKKEKEKYNEHERNLIAIAPSATRRKEKPRVCHEISLIGVNDIIGISFWKTMFISSKAFITYNMIK